MSFITKYIHSKDTSVPNSPVGADIPLQNVLIQTDSNFERCRSSVVTISSATSVPTPVDDLETGQFIFPLSEDDFLRIPVGELCNKYFLIMEDTTSVKEAILRLEHYNYYSLILKHNETYLKFLNRKDIASSFLTYDIMSQNKLLSDLIDPENTPPLVAILSTTTLRECIRIMNENNCDCLLVAEGRTGITGVVSLDDIFRYISVRIEEKDRPPMVISKCDYYASRIVHNIYYQIFYIIFIAATIILTYYFYKFISKWFITLIFSIILAIITFLRIRVIGYQNIQRCDCCEICLLCFLIPSCFAFCLPISHDNKTWNFILGMCAIIASVTFPIEGCCVGLYRTRNAIKQFSAISKLTVSRNKKRFKQDGFDLDLTYITNSCIAMSLPATGIEKIYRNPIKEVARFFDTKHPNRYRIYNLCNERDYNVNYFHGNVVKYPIPDHNVPTIEEMHKFATDARLFLSSNPQNVIAVHCKGGKGRTGCMICAYLLLSGVCETAEEALNLFADKRTYGEIKDQGVSGPSQIRFVHYYERLLNDLSSIYFDNQNFCTLSNEEIESVFHQRYNLSVILSSIIIRNFKNYYPIIVNIDSYDGINLYHSQPILPEKGVAIKINLDLPLQNEFKIYVNKEFFIWQHSYFVNEKEIYFKSQIDLAHRNDKYSNYFNIELKFTKYEVIDPI